MQTLSIVIPAYNEEKRLPRTFALIQSAIRDQVFSTVSLREIVIVDDGSADRTAALSESFQSMLPMRVLRVSPNQGKGNAVHTGLKAAVGDYILVADADSATPWDQLPKLLAALGPESAVAIGSRDLPESDIRTKQSWIREHMGKTFNFLVRLITGLPFHDTQCGFKLMKREAVARFLPELSVKRFAWDVEFLMFAQAFGLKTKEVPVAWEHQDASRVNALLDSAEMLMRVLLMRFRIRRISRRAQKTQQKSP